ncbi:acetyl-CoA carboxylase biotin carboxyl carrier protein [Cytobacillus horneckiae]|uniref:Biotin carboxyl carrier protein of acetyl-CoA carboxylase n=1 Tax=Cytobacillus horneckiae TaxID=549687 RepID=A0A2N0Z9L9_9BACI|nr:acetyl-CoA carboxylase biotin carboxyl carrier protein [Cytobacillus horneckiae]MEC1155387.1 acetyl-CoA carboxylase biotin carboxyl carrier protein [Cytobacillus horneckiae]MED2936561.1 acetyl-CoA carboxylase biotin carboxyl carrier protein [Cytobacillus horneckiae]PKG26206.1 acetyl-CoA carboxylase biotin carboxyl carrier protein [Cytobacillus horneckiae]
MLKVQEIRELIKLVDQSNIEEFIFEHEGSKVEMKKKAGAVAPVAVTPVVQPAVQEVLQTPQPVQTAAVQTEVKPEPAVAEAEKQIDTSDLHQVVSPMVGTFYQSSSPDADAYVKQGSKITKDSVLCIVEAMKLFNEIEAEVDGEIVEILVKDGQLVEYGQPLFLVKPE